MTLSPYSSSRLIDPVTPSLIQPCSTHVLLQMSGGGGGLGGGGQGEGGGGGVLGGDGGVDGSGGEGGGVRGAASCVQS